MTNKKLIGAGLLAGAFALGVVVWVGAWVYDLYHLVSPRDAAGMEH